MLTDVTPDHVAMAVPTLDGAMPRWEDDLGGRTSGWFSNGIFRSRQLRYPNGVKIELLAPHERDEADDNFVRGFLAARGATVHHVTLKVPDIHVAIDQASTAGFDVMDVATDDPWWKEAFLRPSQVGGCVVQLAQDAETDEEWAARLGHEIEDPPADAARPRGPVIAHPSPAEAGAAWERLGATVVGGDDEVVVSWGSSPFEVRVRRGDRMRAVGIAVDGAGPRPQDDLLGAAVLSAGPRPA